MSKQYLTTDALVARTRRAGHQRLLATRFSTGQTVAPERGQGAEVPRAAAAKPGQRTAPSVANDANHGAQPPPQRLAA